MNKGEVLGEGGGGEGGLGAEGEKGEVGIVIASGFTSWSTSTGSMPKKGLMGMEGRMSAPGVEGRGAMQIPPVSGRTKTILLWLQNITSVCVKDQLRV